MAGRGDRFVDKGYNDPKPLIKVNGKMIIEYILDMFDKTDDITFICNDDHLNNTNMKRILKELSPKSSIVSLPNHKQATLEKLPAGEYKKKNTIVYSSRLDKEKNPFFMMKVAEAFLENHPDYEWHVTTSGKSFSSMLPGVLDAMDELAKEML